jgi:hypothetical protein
MRQFVFETPEEFDAFFTGKNVQVTEAITDGIRVAVQARKKHADLFEVTFEGADTAFDISLPSTEWPQALAKCLEIYEQEEMYDDAIDTYQLIKQVSDARDLI